MPELATDLVLYDAAKLQQLLSNNEVTSVQLIEKFLAQIDRHNRSGEKVNAVISTAPRGHLLAQAAALDTERRDGKLRGPLHGIPVLVKDAITTGPDLGMPTTVGSYAFSQLVNRKAAPVVLQIIAAGGIIIAKCNLTEFCGLKSNDTPVGWSAVGGQTNSPYRRDDLKDEDQPMAGGSSSGSAVGIVTGFAPLAIGTETSGSTVYPAGLNGLYGMKLGRGIASTDGVFRLSKDFDGIGVMARTPRDLAVLAEAVMTPEALAQFPHGLLSFVDDGRVKSLKVGVLPVSWGLQNDLLKEKWNLPAVVSRYDGFIDCLRQAGHVLTSPLPAPEADTLRHGDNDLTKVAYYEFPSMIREFLGNFEIKQDLRSLEDIVAWNEGHADRALPAPYTTQTELRVSLESPMTPESRDETVAALRRLADEDGMGKVMDEQNVDVVVAASDSTLVVFAACAGWPVATCPLGKLEKNGQPFGVFVTARSEDKLCQFLGSWQKVMPEIQAPHVSTE